MGTWFRAIWTINPIWGATVSLCAGMMISIASFPTHLAFVSYDAGNGLMKQVGFIPSLNWSIVLVSLFPTAIYTALRSCRQLNKTILSLPNVRMLATKDWQPAKPADAEMLLAQVWSAAAPVGIIFFLAGLCVGFWDYKAVVLDALLSGALPIAPGDADFVKELDWSIAALFGPISDDAVPSVTANLVFSSVAYLLLFVQLSLLLSFYGLLIGLSVVLSRLSDDALPVRLIPDVTSSDRRRGFQRYSTFFLGVLSVSLIAYLCCYLMRVQNLFLRDRTYGRLDQMIFNDLSSILSDRVGLFDDLPSFFSELSEALFQFSDAIFMTGNLADTQAYLGIGLILILVFLIVLAFFSILRGTAEESRQLVHQEIELGDAKPRIEQFYGLSAPTVMARVEPDGMDEWPLKWPKLNAFIAYMALGLACFFFIRLALLWIALQLWQLLRRVPEN